jgi:hypothetical protein
VTRDDVSPAQPGSDAATIADELYAAADPAPAPPASQSKDDMLRPSRDRNGEILGYKHHTPNQAMAAAREAAEAGASSGPYVFRNLILSRSRGQ